MSARADPQYDVSVIIPAWRATEWIARAVASVTGPAAGLGVEIVIAADDDIDYLAHLGGQGLNATHLVQCRTDRSASGPAAARNCAVARASADLIACLDADDAFRPDRLVKLVGPARACGAATGPTIEIAPDGSVRRIARPPAGHERMTIDDICRPRMPIFPVFRKALLADGWPDVDFAEDMVFNAGLLARADAYAFVEDAGYDYHLRAGSITDGAASSDRALRGYGQILELLETNAWPAEITEAVRSAVLEDRRSVEAACRDALAPGRGWRGAVI